MMTRRSLLAAPALLSAQAKQPDIVIVLTDDLGYGDLSCFGHPNIKTPNLDRFATQGIRFTDCYAAAPVCSPSRCGLLTGRTPTRLGVYDWIPEKSPMHLQRSEQTFAKLLQQTGYATAHIGKWHCNGLFNSPAQPQPNDHGFDHWVATQNNSLPSHKDPVNFVRNGQPVGPLAGFPPLNPSASLPASIRRTKRWPPRTPSPRNTAKRRPANAPNTSAMLPKWTITSAG